MRFLFNEVIVKNIFIIVFICFGLVACGKTDQLVAHYTGYSKVCVDGVQYIQFTSGASVQYDKDGKVVNCK